MAVATNGFRTERSQPIGVFDSGLGGLTVVRELSQAMPAEDIVYLGDNARAPYGIRSPETIRRFSLQDACFLLRHAPKIIVIGCNTASAEATDLLESAMPVGVVDVVRPGAAAAVAATDGAIGVIGTRATVNAKAYERAIQALDASRTVYSASCYLLVPIVEEGRDESDPIVLKVLAEYLHDLQRLRPGVLILGCTHYPLLAGSIGKLMGPHVPLINSGRAAALEVQRRLCSTGLAADSGRRGTLRCFTTDNPDRFAELGERFGQRKIDCVEHVGTDELEALPLSVR